MKNKRCFYSFPRTLAHIVSLITILGLYSTYAFSKSNDYQLNQTTDVTVQISKETVNEQASLDQEALSTETQNSSVNSSVNSSINSLVTFFILLIVLGLLFYWFKRNRYSVKSVVRKQFAHIELSESKLQIGLYHRHQKNADTIIDIADIVSSEVKLNEQTVNIINLQHEHGFNYDKEQDLRNIFIKEKIDKMIDGKVRQISVLITDNHGKIYTTCLYMRKGNNRITKKRYLVVIDDLVDWCWLIAKKINPNNTEKRKENLIKPNINAAHLIEKDQDKPPRHNQAAAISSVIHNVDKSSQERAKHNSKEQGVAVEVTDTTDKKSFTPSSNPVDTELVNALEKLVSLKQEGFLTQEEFTKAKENLMQSLFSHK